ncbi:hypothetical protein Sste5344_000618 [Sporothrix stenoceras]
METPSRGSASSPDPLNSRGDDTPNLPLLSSAARPITRSQRSNSIYSLDPHNRMRPSRFSSPRRQTFHLDVGSGTSPQKIRVTVETEDSNANSSTDQDALADEGADFDEKVNRRLFRSSTPVASLIAPTKPVAPSSRRRQRSSSPTKSPPTKTTSATRKSARASTSTSTTTTTKVPLRGLSDDEGASETATVAATPKPKRGRPRRSGTPKPLSTIIEPSSPIASATRAARTASSPVKRGRKPRAATPKAEETAAGDELASVEATSAPSSSPVKRTPRATRKITASIPKSSSAAKNTRSKSTPKSTPKRTASSAFSGSDAESASESRPTKRGRGRPRRQAMVPDEMAAIAENVLEEQEQEQREMHATTTSTQLANVHRAEEDQSQTGLTLITDFESASPDPIMDGPGAIDAQPFHAPTPNTIRRMRVAVSPAPTSLSSVDLISVQTPARPTFETAPASIADNEEKRETEQAEQAATADAAATSNEDSGEDFAYGAPSAEDYFSDDNGFGNYDIPETFDQSDDDAVEPAFTTPIATSSSPVTGSVPDVEPQSTHTTHAAEVAAVETLVETNDVREQAEEEQVVEQVVDQAVAYGEDDSEDELAPPIVSHSDVVEAINDAPIYSEDLYAATPQVGQDRVPITSNTQSSPMMEAPTLTITNVEYTGALPEEEEEEAPEDIIASAAIDRVQDDATVTRSPRDYLPSRRPGMQPDRSVHAQSEDLMHFSSVESPFVHETSISHIQPEAQLAQSELTAADSDGDGDVDAVLLGSAADDEAQSEAESDAPGATTNLRDMDTIAQGEDFSMIGVESLQASFRTTNTTEMPAMGEMTSRIVSRSLQSIRQGNQPTETHDNDGLSYLEFLYESSSNPPSAPASAAKTPRTPKATNSAGFSSPTKENETVQRTTSAPKSDSPRKKSETLRELIARKWLHEAHGSSATPRVVNVAEADKSSDPASPLMTLEHNSNEEYDDSFSEIPESVLEAAVPQTTTHSPFFSRHQAELTGRLDMDFVAVNAEAEAEAEADIASVEQPRDEALTNPTGTTAEEVDQTAQGQQDAEITSSPPIRFGRTQRATSEQAIQRPRLAQENRTTPVAFLSPRYPVTTDNDYLRVPSEGFRPSLSPIVRAGRALQSVTSDPPTPKENEGFLRSPFRSSVARDTQSPAAAQGHDSSSPEPVADEGPIQDQLLRKQETGDDVDAVVDTEQAAPHSEDEDDKIVDNDDNAVNEEEVSDEEESESEDVEHDEHQEQNATTLSQQSQPAVVATQQSPPSMPKAAWKMAKAPFSGFKNLVMSGAQVISPRVTVSAPDSDSPASLPPSTPAGAQVITPTPAARPVQASPQKRTAADAELDAQPGSSAQPATRSIKRLRRLETPSRDADTQAGSGSGSGTNRSWRSYVFRENSVAGSITSFAAKLISRTPNADDTDNHEAVAQVHEAQQVEDAAKNMQTDPDSDAEADSEADSEAQDNMDVNVVAMPEAIANVDAVEGMDVNSAVLPEINTAAAAETTPKATALTSEANSTQYGSDIIMSMVNDISGEGQDVDGMAAIESDADNQSAQGEQDDQDDQGMGTPRMTSAIQPTPGQQYLNDEDMYQDELDEGEDEDVDIWAIEAERTTRFATRQLQQQQPQLSIVPRSAERLAPISEPSPMRDPRLSRIQAQEVTRSGRKQSPMSSPLGSHGSDSAASTILEQNQDDMADELQGPASSVKNSPRPTTGRFLDDFFSSPTALPRQLSPTSKKNIQFNEESRRKAVEQALEHERRREARELAQSARSQRVSRQMQMRASLAASTAQRAQHSSSSSSPPSSEPELSGQQLQDANDAPAATYIQSATIYTATNPVSDAHSAQATTTHTAMSKALDATDAPDVLNPAPASDNHVSSPKSPTSVEASQLQSANAGAASRPTTDNSGIIEDDDMEQLPRNPSERRRLFLQRLAAQGYNTRIRSDSPNVYSPPYAVAPVQPAAAATSQTPADRQSPKAESRPKEDEPSATPPRSEPSPVASPSPISSPVEPPAQSPAAVSPDAPALNRESIVPVTSEVSRRRSIFHRPVLPRPNLIQPITDASGALQFTTPKKPNPHPVETSAAQGTTVTWLQPAQRRYRQEVVEPAHQEAEITDDVDEGDEDDEFDESLQSMEVDEPAYEEAEESSFLTPILKPLPAKTASPTKSCIRPTTKPKTPGRVVEFTSSTMAADPSLVELEMTSQAISAERQGLDYAAQQFAEHFQLDTDNRLPSPVLTDRPVTEANIERVDGDGDVRMWDRKEIAAQQQQQQQQQASHVQGQSQSQGPSFEVDNVVSDMMLADTHQISQLRPYRPIPKTSAAAAAAGEGFFFPSNAVAHVNWTAPEKTVKPPGREWRLDDWVELNNVLQTYRREGQVEFVERNLVPRLRYKKRGDDDPPNSRHLLHKIVHAERVAMLIKRWHLDVVDLFALRSGRVFNEHYLVRRLFSLLISEERRGAFQPWWARV